MSSEDEEPSSSARAPLLSSTPTAEAASSPRRRNEDTRSRRSRSVAALLAAPLLDDQGSPREVLFGLIGIFAIGGSLGLVLPKNEDLPIAWYRVVSSSIGYIYFACWSLSFYPQILSNWRRKSVQGLSVDFCLLNVLGFACYSAYNCCLFFSAKVQSLYRKKHHGAQVTVQSNDVAFAVHAFLLSSVTVLQIYWYGRRHSRRPGDLMPPSLRPSTPVFYVLLTLMGIIGGYPLVVSKKDDMWMLEYVYLLSYIKIFISLLKYIPQVILNFRRKSTVGWSIWNILLDFTGGFLSNLQLVADCGAFGDFSAIPGNLPKLALGSCSMVFDMIFMLQHYVLYPQTHEVDEDPGSSSSVNLLQSSATGDYQEPALLVDAPGDEEDGAAASAGTPDASDHQQP